MIEVLEFFRKNDFQVDTPVADGKLHRLNSDKKKSQWYVVYQNFTQKTGEIFYVGVFGDWRTGEPPFRFCTLGDTKLTPEDRASVKKQIEQAKKKADAHRRQEWEEAAHKYSHEFEQFSLSGHSPYLDSKHIRHDRETYGFRFHGWSLIVPCQDVDGKIWSYQKLESDGSKWFQEGGRTQNCFHVIGDLEKETAPFITEGVATGCSIYLATGRAVVVAFNAGNLQGVALDLKRKYKTKTFVVAGDDDRWTVKESDQTPYNPGRIKAEEAARKILALAVFPQFQSLDGKPTDFNDLHVREGLDQVKLQLLSAKSQKNYVSPLGHRGKSYFVTSSENKQIIEVKTFSESDFLDLMELKYWEANYPGRNEHKVNWTQARSDLMGACRKRGLFESKRIRGAGAWSDDGRVVVNMGDHLLVDGEMVDLDDLETRYFYTIGKKLPHFNFDPLPLEECGRLIKACKMFQWEKNASGVLLAGALVNAKICAALPIRPHIWIAGEKGTGKTTLLERLVFPMLDNFSHYFMSATTEAGIRQTLLADGVPVIFDEFETDSAKETRQSVIELLRASWADSHGAVVKGSAGGVATSYHLRFSAILASIRTSLDMDADKSRISILELAPHGSNETHWSQLETSLDAITPEYIDQLFARSINMVPVLLRNFETLRSAFARRVDSRFGQQYGMLLAGFSILTTDEALNREQAEELIDSVGLEEEKEEAKNTDQEDCLRHLLTKRVTLEVGGDRMDLAIGEAIQQSKTEHYVNLALQRYGIRVQVEKDVVSVAANHTELRNQIFYNTRWIKCWGESLGRLAGAERSKNVRIAGTTIRCTNIPISLFD